MSVRADNEHYARTERYAKEVQSLYFQIADHVARISSTQAFKAGIFTFKDYPVLNRMVDKLIESLRKSMLVVIRSGISKEWDNANENNDALVKYLSSKIKLPEKKYKTRNLKALEAFQGRKINGLGLSERVWNYATQYKTELEQALDVGIADGRSAAQLSRDIREYLREPDKLFRRVRDKNGNLKLSKNALKYNPGAGVYRSSYKNAMRLTRTEINQSYREADYLRWQQMDFVVGIEIRRSNHEYGCPVCESLKGKYPKDFKFIGWHPHCYSDDSFVLTNRGWRLFKDVQDSDKIFSLNPKTREPEWVGITDRQQYHINDKMVRFYNRTLDCLVTPDHEMVYINKSDGEIRRKLALEYRKGNGGFYRGCEWGGSYQKQIQIGSHTFDLGDFAEFMGYWLSDGSLIRNYQIKIAHQDGRESKEDIKECCARMGFDVGGTTGSVDVYSKDLNAYLKQFGLCETKYVPEEIKNADASIIQRFLDAFVKCDGHIKRAKPFMGNRGKMCIPNNNERIYFTTSNQMASDIGELILKIGKRPSYYIDNVRGKEQRFSNGIYTINQDLIRISECNGITATVFDKEFIDYHGDVYDLTLERNHIMYIRRNGKCFWGSNCRCHAIPILSTQKELLDSINDETPVQSKNEVKDMPENFTKWMDENSHRMKSDTQVYNINKEWERIKNVQVDLTQIYGKDTEKVKFRLATPEQTIKVGDFNKVNERINIDIEFPVNIIKSDGTVIKSSGFNSSMTATIDNEKKIITLMKVDVDEKLRRNGIAEYMAWKVKEVTPNGYKIVGSGVYSGGGSGLVAKLEKTGYFKNVSVSKKQLPLWMIENGNLINNQSQSLISFVKAKSAKEAEEWITKNITFIKSADYSGISVREANRLNKHITYLQNKGFMNGCTDTIKLEPFRGKVSDPVGGAYQMFKHGRKDARLRIDVWSDKKFKALEKKAEKQVEKELKKRVANWEAALATIENDLAAYYKNPEMEKFTWGDDRLDLLLKRQKAVKEGMEKDIASFKANNAVRKKDMDFVFNVCENMEDNLTHEMGHALNANLQTNSRAYSSDVRSLLKSMKKKYDYYPDREGILYELDSNLFDRSMLEYGLNVSEYACTKGAEYFAESFTMFMKGKQIPDKKLEELFKLIVRL